MTNTTQFCNIIRRRSEENKKALEVLYSNNLTGQVLALLRQELDSMVRVIYLLFFTDLKEREHFISQTLKGEKWEKRDSKKIVTDREMVELGNKLNGWSRSVYKFGCGFIHLSIYHDYDKTDPFKTITQLETDDIKKHLNYYHGFPLNQELNIETIKSYLPKVFKKISDNLECSLESLENEVIVKFY